MSKLLQSTLFAALIVLLVAAPYNLACAFESFGKVNIGAYADYGQPAEFAVCFGSNNVLATQKETNVRVMQFTGVFHANTTDEIEGLATFTVLEKYFPVKQVKLYMALGAGTLWDMRDDGDDLSADLMAEGGIHVKDWVSFGVGINYLPKDGPDATYMYATLNLITPL